MKPLKVLLVEDSEDDAFLILTELRRGGYELECVRVETPEAFKAELARAKWDIVIADYSLPRFTGLEAIKILVDSRMDVPVIMASGTVGEEVAVAAMKAGASDFILKGKLVRLLPSIERELRECASRRDHLQTKKTLADSQENFKAFMYHSPAIAFIKDKNGQLVYVNETFERIFGLCFEQCRGKTDAELWPAPIAIQNRKNDEYVLRHKKALEVIEEAQHPDGVHNWLVTKFPITKADELMVGCIGIDITERKRLEEQLRQSQKMEAIGHLAGGVAHDFNNLLTVILGRSELVLNRLQSSDAIRKDIQLVKSTAERAATITRQLLQFSRQQVLAPKVININALASELSEMLGRLIGEHIEYSTNLQADLGLIKVDPGQFQQILINLAVNARDAMPKGGKLMVETSNVEFSENHAKRHVLFPGPHVMLAVSDTGCGMDDATLARVFEPFFTTKEFGKGTGLGLSTVYGVVKQSGGSIWVYSEPNHGTTFKIYFPRFYGENKAPAQSTSSALLPIVGGQDTILVVEDEGGVRDLLQDVLKRGGYKVLLAKDADEAFKLSEECKETIHLLLTDVVMPRMGGHELAQILMRRLPDMKVLYMSGYTSNVLVHQGIREASIFFLEKPFTPDKLAMRVREVLQGVKPE